MGCDCDKNVIRIVRGTTNLFDIYIFDDSGEKYVLGENEVIVFGVKKMPTSKNLLIRKEIDISSRDEETGAYQLILEPEDTANLDFTYRGAPYHYDISVQDASDFYNVIMHSDFYLEYNVTELEADI